MISNGYYLLNISGQSLQNYTIQYNSYQYELYLVAMASPQV